MATAPEMRTFLERACRRRVVVPAPVLAADQARPRGRLRGVPSRHQRRGQGLPRLPGGLPPHFRPPGASTGPCTASTRPPTCRPGWTRPSTRPGWPGPLRTQVLTGLESWCTLPTQPGLPPPPRYKMALVTWMTIFPLITLVMVANAGPAGDLEDLGGVWEPEVVDRDRLEGAPLDAAVAAVAGAIRSGCLRRGGKRRRIAPRSQCPRSAGDQARAADHRRARRGEARTGGAA
jgi:hypothetical protein